jgi:hypothetical protein
MSLVPTPRNVPSDAAPTGALSASDRHRRVAVARMLALAVDAVQWLALPFFVPGGASPVNAVLDVCVAIVMTRLLGWHIAFLPSFVAELVPLVDLFPTWTVAVFVATRKNGSTVAPASGPPTPIA